MERRQVGSVTFRQHSRKYPCTAPSAAHGEQPSAMDRRDSNSPVGCMHASASDNDMEGHFSAATTQPSSPRSFLRAGSPQMKNAPWVQVQDRLLKFAEEGDADVDACGELVSCQIAIERSLRPPLVATCCEPVMPCMPSKGSNAVVATCLHQRAISPLRTRAPHLAAVRVPRHPPPPTRGATS